MTATPRTILEMALACGTLASVALPQAPSFPTGTEIVTVDAVVVDHDNRPVTGLSATDFTLLEDGRPQTIAAFEAVSLPATVAGATATTAGRAPERTSSNADESARRSRTFVIVFDERHLDVAQAARGRQALARFLDATPQPGDRVSISGTQSGTTWTARLPEGRATLTQVLDGLRGRKQGDMVKDAISDYEAMRIDRDSDWIVLDRVTRRLVSTGYIQRSAVLPGDPRDNGENLAAERGITESRAAQVWAKAELDNAATLSVIEHALAGMAAARGRKSLVLVSGGFVHDPHVDAFRRVVTAALRANVALYFVDARGLTAAPTALQADISNHTDFNDLGATLAEHENESEGSQSLALDTGGFTVHDNDLLGGLERISRESASYYLLGYKPAAAPADGRFHRIEVKVARSGVRVSARRGYYAPDARAAAPPKEGTDAAIQRALDAPFDLSEVSLQATDHVLGDAALGKKTTAITAEADIRGFAFETRGTIANDTLELLLVVTSRDSLEALRFDQQFVMAFTPETRARYEASGFPIHRTLDLVPGAYQARIVVRDHNSNRVGSLTHDFVVPGDGLRISTPILSDHLLQDTGLPEPMARRAFRPHGVLHCRFEVYGTAHDAKAAKPNVTAGFSIRRSDGRFWAAAAESPLAPGADGNLTRTFGSAIDGAPAGHYEMIVVVTDLVAGQVAEAREPFEITGP